MVSSIKGEDGKMPRTIQPRVQQICQDMYIAEQKAEAEAAAAEAAAWADWQQKVDAQAAVFLMCITNTSGFHCGIVALSTVALLFVITMS